MSKNPFSNIGTKTRLGLTAVGVVVALSYVAGVVFFQQKQETYKVFTDEQKQSYHQPTFTLEDLSASSAVKAQLTWEGKTLPMVVDNGTIKLPATYTDQVLPPYKLEITFQTQPDQYRDMEVIIGPAGHKVDVLVDGFSPENRISMLLGDHAVFDKVPLDWSGRIDISTVIDSGVPMPMCAQVFGTSADSELKLCHPFPIGWVL